jgi:hypothetical protein
MCFSFKLSFSSVMRSNRHRSCNREVSMYRYTGTLIVCSVCSGRNWGVGEGAWRLSSSVQIENHSWWQVRHCSFSLSPSSWLRTEIESDGTRYSLIWTKNGGFCSYSSLFSLNTEPNWLNQAVLLLAYIPRGRIGLEHRLPWRFLWFL